MAQPSLLLNGKMHNNPFTSYIIEERSFVSYVKREIHNLIKDHFSEQRTGEIDIIVSELTSNIVKYAKQGELLYRFATVEDQPVFELVAIDNGPGIKDVDNMMKDGASSTNTLGQGLGAIKRLSNSLQVYSLPGKGSVFYCQVCSEDPADEPEPGDRHVAIAALSVCLPGEKHCGDGYYYEKNGMAMKLFLGDGLGHGEQANVAVTAAIRSFRDSIRESDPVEIIRSMHYDVKKTRGLVGTVALLSIKNKTIRICGVGNIGTKIYKGIVAENVMSYNGIIGLNIPHTLNAKEIVMEKFQTLIMFSDGFKNRWEISQYPGLIKQSPVMIASVIYKDHARRTDDMSILVAKIK